MDSLGDRMKGYESVPSVKLMRRTPVIMRLDGKAFHTWTKRDEFKSEGAFSTMLREMFMEATVNTIKRIQGARLAYMQSDEVSILITDWKQLNTDAWFKYGAQKMVSVAASMFTYYFNEAAGGRLPSNVFTGANSIPAFFDARVFNVPFEEVNNYFVWRQQDATRNSIQMLGREFFSHKRMDRKNVNDIKDMLVNEMGVNWNDTDTKFKRGSCVSSCYVNGRLDFNCDEEIPIFSQHPDYVNDHLVFPD